MCQVIIFLFSHVLGLIVLLSWGSVGCVCVCEQSPRTSLLRGLFSRFISLYVMALLLKVWESLPFRWLQNLTSLFWILIISGHGPNSALRALFGVLHCIPRIFLQNSACNLVFVLFLSQVLRVKCQMSRSVLKTVI